LDTTDFADLAARESALDAYTKHRYPNLMTINDLAMKNYDEMRSGVTSRLYLFRKWVEERVSLYPPASGWRTQCVHVSFGNERYSDVVRSVAWQGRVLKSVIWGCSEAAVLVGDVEEEGEGERGDKVAGQVAGALGQDWSGGAVTRM
jgi:kynurenine 3-monooxygenase